MISASLAEQVARYGAIQSKQHEQRQLEARPGKNNSTARWS